MDILKKMFQQPKADNGQDASGNNKDEFRKPQWFEEAETDDELFDDDRKFAFQVFTNPLELQRHFERQMQRVLESLDDMDDTGINVEKDFREDFLKPGFESQIFREFEKQKRGIIDTDLDGEIYGDQLHSLLQRLNPDGKISSAPQNEEIAKILPSNKKPTRRFFSQPKLTDEEIIMGRIHGTLVGDGSGGSQSERPPRPPSSGRPDIMTPMTPMLPRSGMNPFGGVFDGGYQGPKMFSQSVMTKTIRKPDGTFETTKVTQDSSGNKTTTVTRMVNGKQETVTTYDGKAAGTVAPGKNPSATGAAVIEREPQYANRNLFVTKEGYAMPRNLW